MHRRIQNLIKEGLVSKVYLIAYPERKTPYKIAKEIYGTISEGKETARMGNKIYPLLKKYPFLFDRNDEGILSRVDYLLNELVEEFGLSSDEEKMEKIKEFLDEDLREIVKQNYKEIKRSIDKLDAYSILKGVIKLIQFMSIKYEFLFIIHSFLEDQETSFTEFLTYLEKNPEKGFIDLDLFQEAKDKLWVLNRIQEDFLYKFLKPDPNEIHLIKKIVRRYGEEFIFSELRILAHADLKLITEVIKLLIFHILDLEKEKEKLKKELEECKKKKL